MEQLSYTRKLTSKSISKLSILQNRNRLGITFFLGANGEMVEYDIWNESFFKGKYQSQSQKKNVVELKRRELSRSGLDVPGLFWCELTNTNEFFCPYCNSIGF
jgi:hypothetical protein